MLRLPSAVFPAALLLMAGCLSTEPATQTLDFDLTQPILGDLWEPGGADFPVGSEAQVNLESDRRPVPESIGTANALYISGTNATGDLFVFQKKYWAGLPANRAFRASLRVDFISNVHSGCTTGVGPGVVIKAGVSAFEPRVDVVQNVYRLALDKGTGTAPGDFAQLGDIRNGLTGCPSTGTYSVHATGTVRQSVDLVTDVSGGFWMFIGTQSSVAARHEIYVIGVHLVLQSRQ